MVSACPGVCRRQNLHQKVIPRTPLWISRNGNLRNVSDFCIFRVPLILTTLSFSGLVIDQTRKEGFRFRTVEEYHWRERTSSEETGSKDNIEKERDDKKDTNDSVEDVKDLVDHSGNN